MDVLTIQLEPREGRPGLAARLAINGRDLIELVAAAEAGLGVATPGTYGPASAPKLLMLDGCIGTDEPDSDGDGREATVLFCDCGEPGCWPLLARIVATPETVTWQQFRQPYRDQWSYEQLGPFVFDREEYDDAIVAAINEHARRDRAE